MPYKEKKIEKLYYSIGEVAEMLSESTSLIRFWSNNFSVINPKTNRKGDRMFTKKDVANLKAIHRLVKEKGFTLEGAAKELRNKNASATMENTTEIVERLEDLKGFLEKLKKDL